MVRQFVAVCSIGVAVFLSSCAQTKDLPIVIASTKQLCPRHHIPLVIVQGYCNQEVTCALPNEEYMRLKTYFPYATGPGESFHRSREYPDPIKITYCPDCEAEMKRLLR